MVDEYIDLQILATVDNDYLILVSKDTLNDLVTFDEQLTVRHWDGEKPVVLEPYGGTAVSTEDDDSDVNNLSRLPEVTNKTLDILLDSLTGS